jgi:hypothetical protein
MQLRGYTQRNDDNDSQLRNEVEDQVSKGINFMVS